MPSGKFGYCQVCHRPANHFCVATKDAVCSMECKVANYERVQVIEGSGEDAKNRLQARFLVLQHDAWLLFKALCRLSTKNLQETPDPISIKTKTLSLDLLLSVLEHSGSTFRSTPTIITLIKEDLVISLMNNLASPIDSVFRLSSSLFLALVNWFKLHLKNEIGVFLDSIFLKIIDSPHSSFAHKETALVIFSKFCTDHQLVLEIFLNYDCDSNHTTNLFQQISYQLEKIAQGRFQHTWMSAEQEARLRLLALDALVNTLKSLTMWSQMTSKNRGESGQSRMLDGSASQTAGQSSAGEEFLQPAPRPAFQQQFQSKKELKLKQDAVVKRFNDKPVAGIKMAVEEELIEGSAESVAEFFKSTPGLDKTMIGDFMGDNNDFAKKVLYCFTESLNFQGLPFDEGIRLFVGGFRLPGESQKIDRMMEKFAESYCRVNPGRFATADTAYVLAYATIMLNTDLHNPFVKNRMTYEKFALNVRGIDNGKDLDPAFLQDLFNRIETSEIKMKDEEAKSDLRAAQQLPYKRRMTMFMKESQQMIQRTETLISKKADAADASSKESVPFHQATEADADAVQAMFEIIMYPTLATFSLLLEESEEARTVQLCLDGYRCAIYISTVFEMDTSRQTFVNSLYKFTLLGSTKEMKQKNVEAIKMLLNIAHKDGDKLKDSWSAVLHCISEFEKLQNASGRSVDVFQMNSRANNKGGDSQKRDARSEVLRNVQVISQIEASQVDRVYTGSANLNSEAIVDFVDHLRQVSEEELKLVGAPRVFSLQKIVEITYYNMGRIRLVWNKIWTILSKYFCHAGCHPNLNVSLYAIDALRQLSMKFLEKDELANYQFQKQFLQPFEYIMAHNASSETRELIVHCLGSMIQARHNNVKSGWKSVFVVLTHGARDPHPQLVTSIWKLVQTILAQYFPLIVDTIDECVNCIVALACNAFSEVSLDAIGHLVNCAKYLGGVGLAHAQQQQLQQQQQQQAAEALSSPSAASPVLPPPSPSLAPMQAPSPAGVSANSDSSLKVWFLILTGLSRLIGDSRLAVRSQALQALFKILQAHGHLFSKATWRFLYRGVLFPIFDDVRWVPGGVCALCTEV